jgi:hypothetical protein
MVHYCNLIQKFCLFCLETGPFVHLVFFFVLLVGTAEMQGKAAYIRPKVVEPFLGPGASGSYVHRAAH